MDGKRSVGGGGEDVGDYVEDGVVVGAGSMLLLHVRLLLLALRRARERRSASKSLVLVRRLVR